LLFSLIQAALCAESNVTLISPFAGRITDFFKAKDGKTSYPPHEDPGVTSVQSIFHYYKKFGYKTVVMGASFRTKEQVMELAGCDYLTVSPQLLEELSNSKAEVVKKLDKEHSKSLDIQKLDTSESNFRWLMNEDEMATAKLSEGIRKFASDLKKLELEIKKKVTNFSA